MKEVFWCIEYIATFLEMLMGCYFCGTFVVKEEIFNDRSKVTFLSSIAAVVVITFNSIEFFSYATTAICVILLVILQWIVYKKKHLLSCCLIFVYNDSRDKQAPCMGVLYHISTRLYMANAT